MMRFRWCVKNTRNVGDRRNGGASARTSALPGQQGCWFSGSSQQRRTFNSAIMQQQSA